MELKNVYHKEYLGDGAYVGINSYNDLIVYTQRDNTQRPDRYNQITHWLALDMVMLKRIIEYKSTLDATHGMVKHEEVDDNEKGS